jgi:transmembrane sensor
MIGRTKTNKLWAKAASWHARMAEPSSAEEVAEFEEWLAGDPAHAQAYAEMDAVVDAARAVSPAVEKRSAGRMGILRPALGALLFAVAVVSAIVFLQGAATPAYAAISNSGPAVRGVRFADGTALWLDIGAEVGVRLAGARRDIVVRQGRVRIRPGSSSVPLDVHAGGVRTAPGKAPIDVTANDVQVTVGALVQPVVVSPAAGAGEGRWRVAPGHAVAFDTAGSQDAPLDRSWPAGRLRFADAELGRILALANRHGDPDVEVGDARIAALRVSGVFDLRDTRRLARKLAATLDLRVADDGQRLILRR